MNKITINTEGAQNLPQHLKPNKAKGPDDIPAKFLNEVSIKISPLISFIFQASLDQGQIPSDWKQTRVAPVLKKGDRGQPANYPHSRVVEFQEKTSVGNFIEGL
jgi:hypothetical protein